QYSVTDRSCSTPFGVTAIVTPLQYLQRSGRQALLNAFRRHCHRHLPPLVPALHPRHCSTPFGVTAIVTAPDGSTSPSTTAAQRLSAALPSSRNEAEDGVLHNIDLLNAFRRHCHRHPRNAVSVAHGDNCSTPFGVTAIVT